MLPLKVTAFHLDEYVGMEETIPAFLSLSYTHITHNTQHATHMHIQTLTRNRTLTLTLTLTGQETHPASFRGYLNERLFDKVSPSFREVHLLGGATGKPWSQRLCSF